MCNNYNTLLCMPACMQLTDCSINLGKEFLFCYELLLSVKFPLIEVYSSLHTSLFMPEVSATGRVALYYNLY